MPTIIDNRNSVDPTIKIFDEFYSTNLAVNAADFDIVYGYFRNVCATAEIAGNFTSFLFRVAQQTDQPVITLLQNLQGVNDKLKINQIMCLYLNAFRSKTCLYGVVVEVRPNEAVARNIVQ